MAIGCREFFNNVNSFNSKTSNSNQRTVVTNMEKGKKHFLKRNLKMTKNDWFLGHTTE